jgi:hypothetical protein
VATATLSDGTTQNVTSQATWRSSNPAVVTVSSAGIVTGVGSGEADVMATFQNVSGSQHVRVASAPAATLSTPIPKSPIAGELIDVPRPTLSVENAVATGDIGTVTYRFEVSDLSSFPVDPIRTFTKDGVPQGNGTTSWIVERDLGNDVLWYWRARATNGSITTGFSAVATFRTPTTCTFGVVAPPLLVISLGGLGSSFNISTTAGCGWTATADDWIFISSGSGYAHSLSGSGPATVGTSANVNSSCDARTGVVKVRWTGGGVDIPVSQRGSGSSTCPP